jgi:aromatic ring hydroxylase
MIAAMRAKSGFFARQSPDRQAAIESYYTHAARNDLFLTHSLHEPQLDRSKRRSQQPVPGLALHVVEETSKGLIISGGKLVATAAAYANEMLLWPAVPNFGPGDEPYALACCLPMASPGVRIVCRPSFTHTAPAADYPLSSRYDEMDSAVFFNRVLVPWDRVFLHGDIQLAIEMYPKTRIRELTAHQTNIRLLVKLEFLYALLVRLAQAAGRENAPAANMMLGEAAGQIEIVRSSIMASEYQAETDPENGVLYPDFSALMVGRLMGPRFYPEFLHRIRRIASSSLMQVPSSIADFDTEIGADLDFYYQGAKLSARERTGLLRCAWDVCGTDFGSRHGLYELFYAGDPDQNLERMHREYRYQPELLARFDQFFATLPDTKAVEPQPARRAKASAGN